MGITALGKYVNYPRKPQGIQKGPPYVPKVNPAVIKEWTVKDKKGRTWGQGNAPNVKHDIKKGYDV